MKKYLFLFVLIVSVSNAQQLAAGRLYSATDTTYWKPVYNGPISLVFRARDSVNVTLDLDYCASKQDTAIFQTYRVADSTNSVVGAGLFKGYFIRGGATNNIPGAGAIRLRVTKLTGSGKNGTSTPTYDAYIKEY